MLEITEITCINLKDGLFLKPEYLIHEYISGNKFRKLRYNLLMAKEKGFTKLLTFGGAYSNHVVATAAAGKAFNFETIGIIRGDELATKPLNSSLEYAEKCGMQLKFISRKEYQERHNSKFIDGLKSAFGDFYFIPEGGTNALAVKGCEEILSKEDAEFELICCPVGTGGTIAGIINSSSSHQTVLGFSALKGNFLDKEIAQWTEKNNWELITDYHFGGYAKINSELISFINRFKTDYGIPLDPLYTGKMMYGIVDMMNSGKIDRSTKVLAIHTGGLQGIDGMNFRLKNMNLPQLI